MSDTGSIKRLIQTNPVRAINKDPAKKDHSKKKKGKELPEQEKDNSKGHVNEYI
jgi:hypothetical protein